MRTLSFFIYLSPFYFALWVLSIYLRPLFIYFISIFTLLCGFYLFIYALFYLLVGLHCIFLGLFFQLFSFFFFLFFFFFFFFFLSSFQCQPSLFRELSPGLPIQAFTHFILSAQLIADFMIRDHSFIDISFHFFYFSNYPFLILIIPF